MVASYPRSGNNWVKLVLAELLVGSAKIDGRSKEWFVPMVGQHRDAPGVLPNGGRLIKTHGPYNKVYARCYLSSERRARCSSIAPHATNNGVVQRRKFRRFSSEICRRGHRGKWHVARIRGVVADNCWRQSQHSSSTLRGPSGRYREQARRYGEVSPVSVDESRLHEILENNPIGKVRDGMGEYASGRTLTIANENSTYNNWRTRYSESQLAILKPAMQAMRLGGLRR